jgi:hypothetical protein
MLRGLRVARLRLRLDVTFGPWEVLLINLNLNQTNNLHPDHGMCPFLDSLGPGIDKYAVSASGFDNGPSNVN